MTPDYICKVNAEGNVLRQTKDSDRLQDQDAYAYIKKDRIKIRCTCTSSVRNDIRDRRYSADTADHAGGSYRTWLRPIAKYGTPSTVEIPDAVSEHLQYFDAVLLENHGALTYSDSLLNAYHKMESVEFYARLLWQTMQIGGPQELNKEQVEKLYEIRKTDGTERKTSGKSLPERKSRQTQKPHSCGGGCAASGAEAPTADADLIASITKKVMDQLGM